MTKILPILAFLLLLACRPVGPTYAPKPQRLPETFTAAGGAAGLQSTWWGAFGDPQLSQLIDRALAHSPDLQMAEARLRQARAVEAIQSAAGGPALGLGGQVSRDHLSRNSELLANLPVKPTRMDFTNYQVGFDASWELDLFGHTRRVEEAAHARTEATAERLRDAGLVLASEVARTYLAYRITQRRLGLAQEGLRDREEVSRLATLQADAGQVSRLEVQRAESDRLAFAGTLADLQVGLRQHLAALSVLTDQSVATLETTLGEPRAVPSVPAAPAPGLPADLLRRRPDVRIAERELAAACAEVGVAVADQYPRFSLVGTGGWTSIQSGTLLSDASRTWSVGPKVHLPLFQAGRLRNQVRASEAAYEAAEAAYRKAVLGAVGDVEVALARLGRSEERRQALEAMVEQQRRQSALTDLQLRAGEISKATHLETRKSLLASEDQALQATSQSQSALVALCKALGGGLNP